MSTKKLKKEYQGLKIFSEIYIYITIKIFNSYVCWNILHKDTERKVLRTVLWIDVDRWLFCGYKKKGSDVCIMYIYSSGY